MDMVYVYGCACAWHTVNVIGQSWGVSPLLPLLETESSRAPAPHSASHDGCIGLTDLCAALCMASCACWEIELGPVGLKASAINH